MKIHALWGFEVEVHGRNKRGAGGYGACGEVVQWAMGISAQLG